MSEVKHWTYIKKCQRCGEEIKYLGLEKEKYLYEEFVKVTLMREEKDFDYCGNCKLMTLQELIAYDAESEDCLAM